MNFCEQCCRGGTKVVNGGRTDDDGRVGAKENPLIEATLEFPHYHATFIEISLPTFHLTRDYLRSE